MEKLQKALQKARDQRAAGNALAAHKTSGFSPAPASVDASTSLSADDAWAALAPLDLDRKRLNGHLLVSLDADEKSTPFDILRTKTQLLMQKDGWSRLGVTSPTPSCGKTTTALNLALGFTRQSDLRVILIEFDLRRPTFAQLLGHRPKADITALLRGEASFSDQAVRVRDNLAISMARHATKDPTAILLSQKTQSILTDIESTYAPDLVIFDLPPIMGSDDTRAVLKELDCALIVAKAGITSADQIASSEQDIAGQTNVLGVVLNQCRHIGESGYSYDYGRKA